MKPVPVKGFLHCLLNYLFHCPRVGGEIGWHRVVPEAMGWKRYDERMAVAIVLR